MTSIAVTREADPTLAGAPAPYESPTGRTPSAWTAGRGDESQSDTFRALAWSQDDSIAEPLPYIGEEHPAPEADSPPKVLIGDDAVPLSSRRHRRSTLLYGIAAGFAAAAVGGLVLTVVDTNSMPTETFPVVLQPVQNASIPRPNGEAGNEAVNRAGSQGGVIRPAVQAPAQTGPAGSPARVVPSAGNNPPAANNPPTAGNTPLPSVAPVTPDAPPPPAPEVKTPEFTIPEATTPEVAPPVLVPPVVKPPVVTLPEITPQQVPHPLGPIVFHVPVAPQVPLVPLPNPGVPVSAPAVPDPGITLRPGVTVPPIIPAFSVGTGQ